MCGPGLEQARAVAFEEQLADGLSRGGQAQVEQQPAGVQRVGHAAVPARPELLLEGPVLPAEPPSVLLVEDDVQEDHRAFDELQVVGEELLGPVPAERRRRGGRLGRATALLELPPAAARTGVVAADPGQRAADPRLDRRAERRLRTLEAVGALIGERDRPRSGEDRAGRGPERRVALGFRHDQLDELDHDLRGGHVPFEQRPPESQRGLDADELLESVLRVVERLVHHPRLHAERPRVVPVDGQGDLQPDPDRVLPVVLQVGEDAGAHDGLPLREALYLARGAGARPGVHRVPALAYGDGGHRRSVRGF